MRERKKARPFRIRGLMVDPARLTERREFYFDLLPQMAEWGFNTLWWHFVDNEGFALRLDSHPELTTPHAFAKAETRRLIREAAAFGIDVVPEVETLGHAHYITHLPEYAHLADGTSRVMNACCPSHPDTLRLMEDVIGEVAGLFPSPFFHAGLDEADFSGCKRCERRGRGKPRSWIYAEHVRAIHRVVNGCGKRMIMWADHVEHDPTLLKALPRDIVLCHWQYREVREKPIRRSLKAGFQVITAPSMCHFGNMIQPAAHNFDTMDTLTQTTARLPDKGTLGIVNTWWAPQRGLRDAYTFAVAYTGRLLSTGKAPNRLRFARRFARDYFGLDDPLAARALWELHELTANLTELDALLCRSPAGLHRLINWAGTEEYRERTERISAHVTALQAVAGAVTSHREAFHASLLAAKLVQTCMDGGSKLRHAYEIYEDASSKAGTFRTRETVAVGLSEASDILAGTLRQVDEIRGLVEQEWERTRYTRYPKAYRSRLAVRALERQVLVDRVRGCRDFLRALHGAFHNATRRYLRGGPLPGGV